ALQAPLAATNGFAGTLRKRSRPLVNDPRPLLAQAFMPIVVCVSPATIRTFRTGEAALKSNDAALMPQSGSGNSNHFPETLAAIGDDGEPFGILTACALSRVWS